MKITNTQNINTHRLSKVVLYKIQNNIANMYNWATLLNENVTDLLRRCFKIYLIVDMSK